VPPVICLATSWKICQIIGMSVGNKIVFNLVEFVLIIIILVFIFIDFGFDIEELVTAFAPTLSAVAL
jgi:hypothetical protein